MTIDKILWALTNCDTTTKQVRIDYDTVRAISAALRAGQAAVTKLQDLLEGGDIAGASEKHYDKLSASVWKVIEAWDAALKGDRK